MVRKLTPFGLVIAAIAFALGGYAVAQDTTTPGAEGTPADLFCATPMSGDEGTPETAATPAVAEPSAGPCGTPEAEEGVVVDIAFIDIAYVQTELTIPADADVTFRFTNNGLAAHNFMIDDPKVYSDQLYGGDTVELTVNIPAGTYTYYCTIYGHRAAGMVGTLVVE